jgi:hypothetical protein
MKLLVYMSLYFHAIFVSFQCFMIARYSKRMKVCLLVIYAFLLKVIMNRHGTTLVLLSFCLLIMIGVIVWSHLNIQLAFSFG